MKKLLGRLEQSHERGAVMFLVAGTVIIVLLMGAIAVDLSSVATRGQTLQNAADAAALAGVQTYRETAGDQTAATTAVEDLLMQNGIDLGGSVSYTVDFPDSVYETEVQVTLVETEPDVYLAGVTGVASEVERSATARFQSCDIGCSVEVDIPSPFRSVDAAGTGDGYKPIAIGTRLYALNHNSNYGAIVCIDRATNAACWSSGVSKPAYATGSYSQTNPEMPHTAVYETKIYWTASNSAGTYLFCFETATPAPCSTPTWVNSDTRAWDLTQKDENRGGGTVLVNNRIYVFTDDHRVHCFNPSTTPISRCGNYGNAGKATGLAVAGFPAADPDDGNHGSSIDRIVDEDTGYIYSTLHIPNAVGGVPTCDNNQPNVQYPTGIVVLKNAWSGLYVSINAARDGIVAGADPTSPESQWIVLPQSGGRYAFKSATPGATRVIDSDGLDFNYSTNDPRFGRLLDVSSSVNYDDLWFIDYQGSTSRLRSATTYGGWELFMKDDDNFRTGTYENQIADWVVRPWECEDPSYTPPTGTAAYAEGTWVHCWDTVNDIPCNGFQPSAIHSNADRFSGRLFFYYNSQANQQIVGVCSTGFDGDVDPNDLEIRCVNDVTGAAEDAYAANMATLENRIATYTGIDPGAWGDPHYHEGENRLFYATEHDTSRVLCWDFDYGFCGMVTGYSALHGTVEDYGFISQGDCVYGLGHHAVFWAFQADDIYSECTGSTTSTIIEPCDCSGDWEWGTITFDVDVDLFDEFYIQVENSAGDIVYPTPDPLDPDNPGHSLHTDGLTVDLNHLPVSNDPDNDFLTILVAVDAENDPWAAGEQSFSVEFARAPRLSD